MSIRLSPLPAPVTSPVDMPLMTYDRAFYAYLKSLEAAVKSLAEQNEALRVALNEARGDPTTVYPPVTF